MAANKAVVHVRHLVGRSFVSVRTQSSLRQVPLYQGSLRTEERAWGPWGWGSMVPGAEGRWVERPRPRALGPEGARAGSPLLQEQVRGPRCG